MVKRALIVETLMGLRLIYHDTEDSIKQVKQMLAQYQGDSDSDEEDAQSKQVKSGINHINNTQPHSRANNDYKDNTQIVPSTISNKIIHSSYNEVPSIQWPVQVKKERHATPPVGYDEGDHQDDRTLTSEEVDQFQQGFEGLLHLDCKGEDPSYGESKRMKNDSSKLRIVIPRFEEAAKVVQQKADYQDQYELRIIEQMKNEVTLLTKVNPALQIEVKRLHTSSSSFPTPPLSYPSLPSSSSPSLFWLIQVECAEHKVNPYSALQIRSIKSHSTT